MTKTLADATLGLAKIVTEVYEGTLSGVTDTLNFADTKNAKREDNYNKGTFWSLSGDAAGGMSVVSDYVAETGLITILDALPLMTTADAYAIAGTKFELWQLTQAINQALAEIGDYKQFDDTLTSTIDILEMTLPTGVSDVKEIWLAGELTEPYYWQPFTEWEEINGKLYLGENSNPSQTGYKYRLFYNAPHAYLTAASGTLEEAFDKARFQRLLWTAAVEILQDSYRDKSQDPNVAVLWNRALQEKARLANAHPMPQFSDDPKLSDWFGSNVGVGDRYV